MLLIYHKHRNHSKVKIISFIAFIVSSIAIVIGIIYGIRYGYIEIIMFGMYQYFSRMVAILITAKIINKKYYIDQL